MAPHISLSHMVGGRALGLHHLRPRPYRPRTNGKAERFLRTFLGRSADGAIYANSQQPTGVLAIWLDHYNYRRPHGSLSHHPPAARLAQLNGNNLLGSYT